MSGWLPLPSNPQKTNKKKHQKQTLPECGLLTAILPSSFPQEVMETTWGPGE